ncbi:phosphonate C-P lyase system protein PhnG [Acuticoccus sediminis]|uniref:phosphonate C-P lyase system protein PhnG n=1 Tax=Acuticoccus sediminis TaxID=2184697 RepID=UPI001CFE0F73|nr:phosphonate C-P lyase system protein PhnG [Acuticoccus sediminis]
MSGNDLGGSATGAAGPACPDAHTLGTLARAEPGALKRVAEALLEDLGDVEVLASRTGLAMLPREDSVTGTLFHLGEVLVAEAHIRLGDGVEGYGAVVGRDLERAMAMAVVDAALAAGRAPRFVHDFVAGEAARHAAEDTARLAKVEATRVEMEAF